MFLRVSSLLTLALAGGCGAQQVQLYEGERLPADQVTVLFTNPHLEVTVDRQHTAPANGKLQRIELAAGHHAVEVRCIYSPDVPYHAKGGGPAPALSAEGAKYTMSNLITVTMDGDAQHAYKPRVHFIRNPEGIPGCTVKLFDVTDGGHREEFY